MIYEPGELKVVAYKNGKQWATDTVKTTGAAAKIALTPDRATITADGAGFVLRHGLHHRQGRPDGAARQGIDLTLKSPAPAKSSPWTTATPPAWTPSSSTEHDAFNGLCLVIVRATGSGTITLNATSPDLKAGKVEIQAKAPSL